MNDSLFTMKDIVKYLIVGGLVYTILKMIPSVQLSDKDLILLLAIITVGFVCLDCVFFKKTEGFENNYPFILDLKNKTNTKQKSYSANSDKKLEFEDSDESEKTPTKKNTQASSSKQSKQSKQSTQAPSSQQSTQARSSQQSTSSSPSSPSTPSKQSTQSKQSKQSTPSKQNVQEEKNIVKDEQNNAIKSSKIADDKLSNLKMRKIEATENGAEDEVQDINKEIAIVAKSKVIADEHIDIINKRIDLIEKKLTNIPVSKTEEKNLAIQERNIAQEKIIVADELKTIIENRDSDPNEIKQIIQEKTNAIKVLNEAENRIIVIDDSINSSKNNIDLPKTSCGIEVEKIKKQMEQQLVELKDQLKSKSNISPSNTKIANKYFEFLINDLSDKGILDSIDIDNFQAKLRSKLLTIDEVISSLEILKQEGKVKNKLQDGKVKNDHQYSELPSEFYTPIGQQVPNEWANEYAILNTNKWQVPMARPPVCINTQPCKVCPSEASTYSVNLKEWDDSRYVTSGKINKKWAQDQDSA